MNEVKRALFVPKMKHAGYNCSVEVMEIEGIVKINFLAGPGKGGGGYEADLIDLLGGDDEGQSEFWVGDVLVRFNTLEFSRNYLVLNFEETISFMESLKHTFVRSE